MHEYARGVQALNNEGAILARHYFGASTQIDPSHYWSLAYLGVCQLYLGEWDDAKALLTEVADEDKDPNIQGFVKYWLALLEYRQGNFQQASILLNQVQKLGLTEAKKTPLARRVEQLHARVVLMQSTPNSEQQIDTFTDEFDDLSLIDSFFDTAIENSVNKLKEHVRRLTIKGYKPALFTRLLALSQHDELEVQERQRYLNHALDVINQLQQPYEHAQALLLTVRYGLLYGEASGIDAHQVEAFLEQAKDLAIELDARILLARVEYYQQLVEINEMLTDNPNGAADALKQFSHTLETVPLSTEFRPLVDQLLELGNPNF
jgi:tetratricopeptide (TPR) repeat protein